MKRLLPALGLLIIFLIFGAGVHLQAGWIRGLDRFGETFLRPGLNAENLRMFERVTQLGSTLYLTLFTAFIAIALWVFHKRRDILPYVVAALLSTVLANGIKLLFQRPRPPYGAIVEAGYSFPSGHSTSSTVIYGLVILLGCLYFRKKSHKVIGGVIFGAVILTVMWSRVYLGVHYLSDVLGGFFLGMTLICFFRVFKRW